HPVAFHQHHGGHTGLGEAPPHLAQPRLGIGLTGERLGRPGQCLAVRTLVPPAPRHLTRSLSGVSATHASVRYGRPRPELSRRLRPATGRPPLDRPEAIAAVGIRYRACRGAPCSSSAAPVRAGRLLPSRCWPAWTGSGG